ncbi:MAG: hypothetical protein M1820_002407 [Bogoriella megaspora]|nr:MAG: hypothetical protein M1820_002407 [Bogoriella megaspora]
MSQSQPQAQSHAQYNYYAPPPPPPKPSTHSSGHGTPLSGPPLPPPPGQATQSYHELSAEAHSSSQGPYQPSDAPQEAPIPLPEGGWLPSNLKDKSTTDLHHLLTTPALQTALLHSPHTTHPSLPKSTSTLHSHLSTNIALASSLETLETQVHHQRQVTQSRLLALRAQEQQHRAKMAETEDALRAWSPMALYQRLAAGVVEQEALCKGVVESFLEEDGRGMAGEREVGEWVRRVREARRTACLRRERKERWDEGRVGGWR